MQPALAGFPMQAALENPCVVGLLLKNWRQAPDPVAFNLAPSLPWGAPASAGG